MLRLAEACSTLQFPAAGRVNVSGGAVVGAAPAVRAMSSGQLGEFPLYVFTSDGVWALARGADGAGFRAVQAVSARRCCNPWVIAVTGRGVVFADTSGLMRIDGSTVTSLVDTLSDEDAPSPSFWRGCRLWHDEGTDRLWVYSADEERALRYDCVEKRWTPRLWHPGYTADGCRLAVDAAGRVYGGLSARIPVAGGGDDGDDAAAGGGSLIAPRRWVVETLPMNLEGSGGRSKVRGVAVVGEHLSDVDVELYGCDTPGRWRLVARGVPPLHGLCGRGWRWWRVQVAATALSAECAEGVLIML